MIRRKKPSKKIGKAKKTTKAKKIGNHYDTNSHNYHINISGLFNTEIINNIDELKKQYRDLAKKYHPDAGGTKEQFQELQKEYDKLFKKLLSNSNFSEDQKKNEIEIDEAIRSVIDALVSLEGIKIELIGKWIWVSGNTYPIRAELKKAGLIFIKKNNEPYWIYKGVESTGRGKMELNEIKAKYGVMEYKPEHKGKKLNGVKLKKTKLVTALKKLIKGLNKRPI